MLRNLCVLVADLGSVGETGAAHRVGEVTSMQSMPRWTAIGTLPVVSGVLVGLNALYMILGAFGNITDFDVNQRFMQHVLAMDTTNLGQPPGTRS
jgi:hypothetical protein